MVRSEAGTEGAGQGLDAVVEIRRKPQWLRIRLNTSADFTAVGRSIHEGALHTVCEEARCPNRHECWGTHRTASLMILGDVCTRRCRFCAVATGLPGKVDLLEPARVAEAVRKMGLRHVHVTMVNRDDLEDGGASVVAATVRSIRRRVSGCRVEVLTSDFMGRRESIRTVVESRPDITSHNLETVRRLTPRVRSRSTYDRSLGFLAVARELDPDGITKSSLMLGLGEERDEVIQTLRDLRAVGVDMVNLGQYLQPTKNHAPVARYWTPQEFRDLAEAAREIGFPHCESGPLVRSSYHAAEQFDALRQRIAESRRTLGGR